VEVSMKLVKLAEELIATEEQFNRSILWGHGHYMLIDWNFDCLIEASSISA
jgi:hypothetical protein